MRFSAHLHSAWLIVFQCERQNETKGKIDSESNGFVLRPLIYNYHEKRSQWPVVEV